MAIQIKDLRKSFSNKEILKGIDFTFEQGKINMIIGASGSGKSVMMKCIVGLMKPTAGQVLYDGMNFHEARHKEVRNFRKNMGMLFQYSALFDSMTVEENVAFPLQLFTKYTSKAINHRVRFCLERVNMSGTGHLYPAELSGGMMKRVGIARAIALNPKYLFVDEPNSGLDPLTASVVDELIKEITYEFNMCTVVVSHDMNSVVNISDKIMFLHKGVKAWEGDKRSILRSGNPNLDKFVFVSDLIRRDLYDEEDTSQTSGTIQITREQAEAIVAREEEANNSLVTLSDFQARQSPAEQETATPKEETIALPPENSTPELPENPVSLEDAIEEAVESEASESIEAAAEQIRQQILEESVPLEETQTPDESENPSAESGIIPSEVLSPQTEVMEEEQVSEKELAPEEKAAAEPEAKELNPFEVESPSVQAIAKVDVAEKELAPEEKPDRITPAEHIAESTAKAQELPSVTEKDSSKDASNSSLASSKSKDKKSHAAKQTAPVKSKDKGAKQKKGKGKKAKRKLHPADERRLKRRKK